MRLLVIDETAVARPPVEQAALGPALLDLLDGTADTEVVRLYRCAPTVGFTGRDGVSAGFAAAVAAADRHGFAAVRRAPGGRAAAYHPGCLCLDQVGRFGPEGRDITARFGRFAAVTAAALAGLGVPAEVGELPGEFCPGPFSVHDGRGRKLAGSAQRLTRAGWLFSSVVVVTDPHPLRSVLAPVYAALALPFAAGTVGAVADTVPGVTVPEVAAALLDRLAGGAEREAAGWPAGALERARSQQQRYRAL